MEKVEQYIISKKGSEFEQDIQGVKEMGEIHHGNSISVKTFLLKELAKLFQEQS